MVGRAHDHRESVAHVEHVDPRFAPGGRLRRNREERNHPHGAEAAQRNAARRQQPRTSDDRRRHGPRLGRVAFEHSSGQLREPFAPLALAQEYARQARERDAALAGRSLEAVFATIVAAQALLDRAAQPRRLVHGDATAGNVLDDGRLWLIDWEYAQLADPVFDLAVVLTYYPQARRYLQQLIMESIGKEFDRNGAAVNQGLTVYGNKGSTDQHAYVQQLREGVANFFVTFIEVLKDRGGVSQQVEDGITSGDFLFGFFQGTRTALYENGRESMTITINQVDAFTIGVLIALFERSVGFYASLVNINAYHQPGVEAGKKAAGAVISLQKAVIGVLQQKRLSMSAEKIAGVLEKPEEAEMIFSLLRHLAANPGSGIVQDDCVHVTEATFRISD